MVLRSDRMSYRVTINDHLYDNISNTKTRTNMNNEEIILSGLQQWWA